MELLLKTADIVRELAGDSYLYFDTALQIKVNPHTYPANYWAVCVSPKNELYVMDSFEKWHQVEEADTLVLNSLYQRVQIIKIK